MGKRGSSTAGAAATAVKKAKTSAMAADVDTPTVGNWV
jgi:hypothetical protein